jgi:lipid II:glycine glycyltransferase (peptidoglycan interpeptide bridge formation enzyme)
MCPVYDQRVIYEWYIGGEDGIHKGVYPSILATWAAIRYATEKHMTTFDFLGAGKPGEEYGVREFKVSFGGDVVNYGRFTRINDRFLYFIGKTGITLLKKLS